MPRTLDFAAPLLLVAITLAGMAPASGSNPSGPPVYVPEVFYGVDQSFDFTNGFAPLGAFDYVGDDEGPLQSCIKVGSPDDERTNVPTCWANREPAASKSRVHLEILNEEYRDPDARAGVGLRYELKPRCVGQVWDSSHPMSVTMAYDRGVSVDTFGGGVAFAEVWGNALRGRGYEGVADSLQPPQPIEPEMLNQRLGLWEGTTSLSLSRAPPATFTVVPDAPDVYDAMVYSRAHGTVAGSDTAAMAYAQVDLDLDSITFDWTDTNPPTIEEIFWQGTAPPVSSDGVSWWTSDYPVLKVRGEDDFSCPHRVHWQPRAGTPMPYAGHFFSDKTGAVFFGIEGFYHGDLWITDGQGNPSPGTHEVKVGIDLTKPAVAVTTTPAEPDGTGGWFVTAPIVHFTCLDHGSGCTTLSWWTGGSNPKAHSANFARTPGQEATVDTAPLPAGWDHLWSCNVRDFAGHLTSCAGGIDVDLADPTIQFYCPTSGITGCMDGWLPGGGTLRVDCHDPWPGAGIASVRHRVDEGEWVASSDYTIPMLPVGTVVVVEGECRDHAGRATAATHVGTVDSAPPSAPTLSEPTGQTYFRQTAKPQLSFPSTDEGSGILHYRLTLDGAFHVTRTEPTWDFPGAVADGWHDLRIVALDLAGNTSPAAEFRFFLDGHAPTGKLEDPVGGAVYINGKRTTPGPGQQLEALAIGGSIPLKVTASDVGSGLASVRVITYASDGTHPVVLECQDMAPGTCSGSFHPEGMGTLAGFSVAPRVHHFEARVTDKAGHDVKAGYVRVEYWTLAAGGTTTAAGLPYVGVDWAKYEGNDFVAYELHRGLTADFIPSIATKLMSTSQQDSVSFRDKSAVFDQVYYYKVNVIGTGGSAWTNVFGAKVDSGVTYNPDEKDYRDHEMKMMS